MVKGDLAMVKGENPLQDSFLSSRASLNMRLLDKEYSLINISKTILNKNLGTNAYATETLLTHYILTLGCHKQ